MCNLYRKEKEASFLKNKSLTNWSTDLLEADVEGDSKSDSEQEALGRDDLGVLDGIIDEELESGAVSSTI